MPALFNLNRGDAPDYMNAFWPADMGPGVPGTYGVKGGAARLTSMGREVWADYCYHAARKFASEEPGPVRLYQVPAFELHAGEEYGGATIGEVKLALEGLGRIYGIAHEQLGGANLSPEVMLLGPMSPSIRMPDLVTSRWNAPQPGAWTANYDSTAPDMALGVAPT